MTGTENEIPGLTTISWGIKVVKNLDTGGLWEDKLYKLYCYGYVRLQIGSRALRVGKRLELG